MRRRQWFRRAGVDGEGRGWDGADASEGTEGYEIQQALIQTTGLVDVGVAGFEPATPSSRTKCATVLRYTPIPLLTT